MPYPIIVLEGPDASGKTTLAKKIVELSGGKYLHLTYRFKDRMFDYHTAAFELALRWSQTQTVVIDRWWPSEKIYADVFRHGSRWPLGGRILDRVALRYGVTYVFCIPSDKEKHLARFEEMRSTGREMYDTLGDLRAHYMILASKMSKRDDVFAYDIETHGKFYEEYAMTIYQNAVDRTYGLPLACLHHKTRIFAGNPFAPIVLVGDKSNPKTRREVWPFFEYGNSSLWLTEKLEALGLPEDQLLWVNATTDSLELAFAIHDIINFAPRKAIIAMGNNAKKALRGLGIEYTDVIYHPQYYKRFMKDDKLNSLKRYVPT